MLFPTRTSNLRGKHLVPEKQPHAPPVLRHYQQIHAIEPVKHTKKELQHHDADVELNKKNGKVSQREERNANSNRGGLKVFQIHGALCHSQGPLLPVKGSAPSYAQLHIYDPSYAAQRQSERSENMENENIENLSTVIFQCNPFARICRHPYEILSNHESSSINSGERSNNNGSTESGLPYIIISPSLRMCLIEGDG
ncbi:hypothetical protein RMATCC62417_15704 [Rhizopus microsporus]|nr:hypothetical protein RMATCC62417_15704 [Rhizopus microsporus]